MHVNRLCWQLQGIHAYLLQLSSCFAATSGAIGDNDSWLTKPLMVQVVKCILQGCWIAPVVLKHSKQSSSALFQIMREASSARLNMLLAKHKQAACMQQNL